MGPITDVIDILKSLSSSAKLGTAAIFSPKKSISARAMDGTCVFPMVIDGELIPLEDAMTIARAWERQCASFVLTSFTMSPYLRHGDEDISAADYVKKFHVNMNVGTGNSIGGLNLESFDKRCEELGINYAMLEGSAMVAAYNIYQGITSRLAEMELANGNYVVEAMLNPTTVNNISRRPVMEAGGPQPSKRSENGAEGAAGTDGERGGGNNSTYQHKSRSGNNITNNTAIVGGQGGKGGRGGEGGKAKANATGIGTLNINNGNNNDSGAKARFGNRRLDDRRQLNHTIDAEFRKANDAVPTMLHIRVYPLDTKNEASPVSEEAIDFVLGVKVQLHPVDSQTMVRELARGFGHNDTLFNFIKWTTGETKFVKDFLLNIDQQELDAYQSVRGGNASLIVASKRRRNIARVWNKFADNPLTPILTIVATDDDFDMLRSEYGYDIDRLPTLITDIMTNFYLLGFMKVNMNSEKVDMWIDGQGQRPQTYTLSTLSKENTTDDRKFKEMMKLIGRRM